MVVCCSLLTYSMETSLLKLLDSIGFIFDQAVSLATAANWAVFTSHRSGKTADDFIADLTVGLASGHMKSAPHAAGVSAWPSTISCWTLRKSLVPKHSILPLHPLGQVKVQYLNAIK